MKRNLADDAGTGEDHRGGQGRVVAEHRQCRAESADGHLSKAVQAGGGTGDAGHHADRFGERGRRGDTEAGGEYKQGQQQDGQ